MSDNNPWIDPPKAGERLVTREHPDGAEVSGFTALETPGTWRVTFCRNGRGIVPAPIIMDSHDVHTARIKASLLEDKS